MNTSIAARLAILSVMALQHETRVRVRYAETDQMGVVYHGNYVPWMEVGRVEFFRALGHRYRDMEAEGMLMAVVDMGLRYHAPARYDDEIIIRTRVEESNARLIKFHYDILHADTRQLLASGFTRHFFLNKEMKPARVTGKYLEVFARLAANSEDPKRDN